VRRRLARRIAADLTHGRQVTLITTAPPHALGLIGLYVKRRCPAVRWVMDWQDLWSYDENYYLRAPSVYRSRLRRLERMMLECADLNVTTNEVAESILAEHYGVPSQQLLHISHHFDRSDFDQAELRNSDPASGSAGPVRIGFLGSLFKPPRVPGVELVEALEAMRASGIDVELHIHGAVGSELADQFVNCGALCLHGRVSHEESVSRLAEYDYLLLLLADLPNCKAVMSIKLPHYMVVDRPILAIVPKQSAIARIVRETGTGLVIPVEEDWRSELREIVQSPGRGSRVPRRVPEAIEEFAWTRLSDRWVQAIAGIPP